MIGSRRLRCQLSWPASRGSRLAAGGWRLAVRGSDSPTASIGYSSPVTAGSRHARSPTRGLLIGLILTLAAVVAYSLYINRQIAGLRVLQSELVDRNRKDSLQLLRIQNNLNLLGLAMRDMLDDDHSYPMIAWSQQFARIRGDLDDALARQGELAAASRSPADRDRLSDSLTEFWDAVDRTFALAGDGREDAARAQVSLSLQARQAALSTAVARLLIGNNEAEEQTAARVQGIYDQVQRQVYWFLTATLVAIAATGLYLIRANRRLFAEMASLSDGRRELAQQLIATRESTLRHLSRELHDEVGQILTAIGSMLGRAEKQTPAGSALRAELREIGEMAQGSLNNVRSLSQSLHPSILEELGLESTFDWYLGTVEKQLGLAVTYERSGVPTPVNATVGIHVYRVLQEALSNAARHSGADRVWVRLRYLTGMLELEVEDRGSGLGLRTARRGLGLVAMRERAELVGGTIEFRRPDEGGTLVRLRVPLEEAEAL
jgi:signal transduction histidine kinase